jgi:putative aldouronate transport system permease protein
VKTAFGKEEIMVNGKTLFYRITNMMLGLFLIFCAVLCIYPVLYIVFASFSDPMQLTLHTGALFYPLDPSPGGYKVALSYKSVGTGYYTTIKIVIFGTVLNMVVTTMAAYAISRKDIYFWKFTNVISVITMFFSGGLVPFYLVVTSSPCSWFYVKYWF